MSIHQIVNLYGLAFAVLLALPHILYRRHHPIDPADYPNRALYLLDRIGRIGSLLLLSFHTGILEKGFTEPKELMQRFWVISTLLLIAVYWLLWWRFAKHPRRGTAYGIVAASGAAVILSGILQVNTLLLTAGIVYTIGEIYIVKCTT